MDKRVYDAVMGFVLRTTTRVHKLVHRVSGGRLGRRFPGGQQVVWITTLGRKSGEWRTTPLLAVRDGADPLAAWVVTGSNVGQAKVPGWVFNVRAHAEGSLLVGEERWAVRFEEALGADRDALYARLIEVWKSYERYERMAGRDIPVFRVHLLKPLSQP